MTTNNEFDLAPMAQKLGELAAMEPTTKEAGEEIANILTDWYLGAVDHGDEAFVDAIVVIANRANQLTDTVEHQSAFISALVTMADALTDQRNRAFEELEQVDQGIEAISNYQMPEHPKLANLYDNFADSHNEAFWESLPYDMAAALGKPWQFYDADHLFTAITVDMELIDEDGADYGYTPAELQAFRDQLLLMVRKLTRTQ